MPLIPLVGVSALVPTDFPVTGVKNMNSINTKPCVLTNLNIKVSFEELVRKIRTGTKRPDILATMEQTLQRVNNIWNPGIVYRWLPFGQDENDPGKSIVLGNKPVILDLGHSTRFVHRADQVLVAIYSAGKELEEESQRASDDQELLISYLLDLVGLLVLEKTGEIITKLAEQRAAELGWGVSPFLSPGSVHGWELRDQLKLCSLLPLNEIKITVSDDAVLSPFKSLSCLIGIGEGYEATRVGTTCQVCSKNKDCEMKQLS